MPAPHHFGFHPVSRDGAADKICQAHHVVLQLFGAALAISIESVDQLFELSDGEEAAVSSEIAHLRTKVLKGRETRFCRNRNRAQSILGVVFPRHDRSRWIVPL